MRFRSFMQAISELSENWMRRRVIPFLPRLTRSSTADRIFRPPIHTSATTQRTRAMTTRVAQALAKIMQEDLTMKAVNDSENRQTLLYGMGDQHLDIIISKLLTKYKS